MSKLTVACVLRRSPDFDEDYVERLKDGVAANLSMPYEFVCLHDHDGLQHDWGKWWCKLEAFRLPPPVLYFDLDTIITGHLDDIADHALQSPFTTLRDFYRPKNVGSGMMSWASDMSWLYERFCIQPSLTMEHYRRIGDQGYIEDNAAVSHKWQDVLPGQVVSYKAHCAEDVPEDARVVCFHGKPRPREIAWKL